MLLEFRIRNFRSVAEEQLFSMLPGKGATHVHHVDSKYYPEALKVAAVYGPNGSGKSNLVKALSFMQRLVTESANFNSDDEIDVQPHVLDDTFRNEPSFFEITFGQNNDVWRYGFEVNSTRVISEWLFSRAFDTSRERRIFDRRSSHSGDYDVHLCRDLIGYRNILSDKTNSNQLYLSKLDQFAAKDIRAAYLWIVMGLRPVQSVNDFPKAITADWCSTESRRRTVTEFLKATDVQIDDIVVETTRHNVKTARELLPVLPDADPIISFDKDHFTHYNVMFSREARDGSSVRMPFRDESLGTRNLFSLAGPIMQSLDFGFCLIIDEMNQSFHPELLKFIVELFYSQDLNEQGAQLIMTSHDVSIMDVLERDQIWLCQKGVSGATDLYALSDFGTTREGGPRRKVAFAKQYLENRFGALPSLNKIALLEAVRTYREQNAKGQTEDTQ